MVYLPLRPLVKLPSKGFAEKRSRGRRQGRAGRGIVRQVTALVLTASAVVLFGTKPAPAGSVETTQRLCASCHGAHGRPADHTVPIIWGTGARISAQAAQRLSQRRSRQPNHVVDCGKPERRSDCAAGNLFRGRRVAGALEAGAVCRSRGDRDLSGVSRRKSGWRCECIGCRAAAGRSVFGLFDRDDERLCERRAREQPDDVGADANLVAD